MSEASGRGALLTKSLFRSGSECPKRLWLDVHEPSLRKPAGAAALARMKAGLEVGDRARGLYPEGVLVWNPGMGREEAAALTAKVMAGGAKCVFEATFIADGCLARADVIWRNGDGRWNLDEVKASKDKAPLELQKKGYVHDLEFQRRVMRKAGHSVGLGRLVLLSREYVWPGGDYVLDGLLVQRDLTAECEAIEAEVDRSATELKIILARSQAPEVEPDKRCGKCGYYDHCHKDEPTYHLALLPDIRTKKLSELRALGVRSIGEIPADFKLSDHQSKIRDVHATGVAFVSPDLGGVLETIRFPAAFIDFEACMPALPQYEGTGSYASVCFQWSAHVLKTPNAEPTHFEFLQTSLDDPRAAFCASLWEVFKDAETILVYSDYEGTQLRSMATAGIPHAADLCDAVESKGVDLNILVKDHVYFPEFRGSVSIKKVLPALVPKLSYEGLEIADGDTAQAEFLRMVSPETLAEDKRSIAKALLEYCKLDTLAMVEVFRALQRLASV